MAKLSCLEYQEVQFTKDGAVFDRTELDAALAMAAGGATDLFVLSHGWNNDMPEARHLYERLATFLCNALAERHDRARQFAVVGLLWPSKRFTEPASMPGGGASLGQTADPVIAPVREQLEGLLPDDVADTVTELLRDVEDSRTARNRLVNLVLEEWRRLPIEPDEAPDGFLDSPPDDLLIAMAARPSLAELDGLPRVSSSEQGTGLGLFTGRGIAGALNFLNVFTYYTMRHRAGVVGANGGNELLRSIRERAPSARLHLVGHSFGARLVTAATHGVSADKGVRVDSLSLLQAAFSQHAFARDFNGAAGFFRRVVDPGLVDGPIIVTHTRNDVAVRTLYPLASRIARQVASFVGQRADPYAGLGAVGAHPGSTPEARDSQVPDGWASFDLLPRRINNLRADTVISGHSEIANDAVGRALVAAALG